MEVKMYRRVYHQRFLLLISVLVVAYIVLVYFRV